jgi:ABC-type enterochelin transport system substrate-binding protein
MISLLDEMIAAERRQDIMRRSAHEQRMKDAQKAANLPKQPNRIVAFALGALTFRTEWLHRFH